MSEAQTIRHILYVMTGFVTVNVVVFSIIGGLAASLFFVVSLPLTAYYLAAFALMGGSNK